MTSELISSQTLTSWSGTIDFTNIPQTHDDLMLVMSLRTPSTSGSGVYTPIVLPNATGSISQRTLRGNGATATSSSNSGLTINGMFKVPGGKNTANTFCSTEVYIPNYAGNQAKSMSVTSVEENNTMTDEHMVDTLVGAALWSLSDPITSLRITSNNQGLQSESFVANSSFYLYGFSHS